MRMLPKTASARRHLFVVGLLVPILLAGAWTSYFLIRFDLNDYRDTVAKELSSRLSLPVQIGDIRYKLHETNLALQVNGLTLGDDTSALEVDLPSLLLDLQWRGLLAGEFRFSRVSLTRPQFRIRLTDAEQLNAGISLSSTPFVADQALLYNTRIQALAIRHGTLHVEIPDAERAMQRVRIDDIQGEWADIRLNQISRLDLKGSMRLPGQDLPSPLQLLGGSAINLDADKGLTTYADLGLKIEGLNLGLLRTTLFRSLKDLRIEGACDLALHVTGTLGESIDFQAEFSSEGTDILPGDLLSSPVHVQNMYASGRLKTERHQHVLSNLSLQVDESRLAGDITWTSFQRPLLVQALLVNGTLTIPQFKQWLPQGYPTLEALRRHLQDTGQLHLERCEFQFDQSAGGHDAWRIDRLQGALQNVVWQQDAAPELEIKALSFDLDTVRWRVDGGNLRAGTTEMNVTGRGEYDKRGFQVTSLDFSGRTRPRDFLAEWAIPQGDVMIEGPVVMNGHLEGPHDRLILDLQADLSRLSLSHPAGFKLSPAEGDKLAIHATLSPERLRLDHGAVTWSAAKGHITGGYLTGHPDSLELEALLTIADLTRLAETLPILNTLQLRGQADLRIVQRGQFAHNRPDMVLSLRDAGLRATRHIADLSQINGRVNLSPNGLKADNLHVHLGESPVTVNAELFDFTKPRLVLEVSGPTVKAKDVVFFSQTALLRDLNGRLEIDQDGLSFEPVNVRLDGGTKASVRGTIAFQPPYAVHLAITSDFADIAEVINLWTGRADADRVPSSTEAAPSEIAAAPVEITISASVERGDLYGMAFHKATGVVRPSVKNLLIHPLDFSVGEGYCNAQVLVDFQEHGPSRLRVSGHAEDVDALEVYRELLNQKNIVRGGLRGDFYLQGEIGETFLPSSYGRFKIQIRDGVLHSFPILSKVFSLLNVSQIFALQLPDMDREGMPFKTLKANFLLEEGVLKTEDLTIQSEAMNQAYAGQQDLISREIDLALAVHPLGTVDKIISRIPVAGWLLTGENRALLSAHFRIAGKTPDVSVQLMPLDTLSEPTIGLLRRTLGLPFKLLEDPQILWGGETDQE